MAEVIESSLVMKTTASMAKKMKLILYSEQEVSLKVPSYHFYPFDKELDMYNFCKILIETLRHFNESCIR